MFDFCKTICFLLLIIACNIQFIRGDEEVKRNSTEMENSLEQSPPLANYTLYGGKERITINNARYPVNVTHITITDPHNTVYVFWSHNASTDIYLQTKDQYEEYQSRSYFYKIRKNDQFQWKIKNVTSSISSKKVQRIVNRINGQKDGDTKYAFQDDKFRMKILVNGITKLMVAGDKNKYELKISTAEFEADIKFKDFIFIDYTENTLSFCGLYNDTEAVLLMTDYDLKRPRDIYKFSTSLQDVLCINPKINFPDTWLSTNLEASIADVYKSNTSRGVLIATQLIEPLSLDAARMLGTKHLQSVISFNHGRTWKTLKLHNDCRQTRDQPNLYIDQSFSRLQFNHRHLGVLESLDSTGVVIATGQMFYLDNPDDSFPGVFVSHDGGLNWKKVFHERLIVTAIHPEWEVMLAVLDCLRGSTKRIYLSNDLGNNWIYHDIFEEEVCVHNVVSGGGNDSSAFAILSTKPNQDGWIITILDFEELSQLSKPCKDSYMELWPPKSGPHFCIKGEKMLTRRRDPRKLCSVSAYHLQQAVVPHNCSCAYYDFVCREGKSCPSLGPTSLLKFLEKHKSESQSSNNTNSRNVSLANGGGDIYRKLPFVLGYRKKVRNSCILTKSLYERPSLPTCKEGINKEVYQSSNEEIYRLSMLLPVFLIIIHASFRMF